MRTTEHRDGYPERIAEHASIRIRHMLGETTADRSCHRSSRLGAPRDAPTRSHASSRRAKATADAGADERVSRPLGNRNP